MDLTMESFRKICPGIDDRFLKMHLSRLDDRYFKRFSEEELCRHARGLSRITPDHPVEVFLKKRRDQTVDCTVMAFDYPAEFSLISGVLSGLGFEIVSGDVFTYRQEMPERRPSRTRKRGAYLKVSQDPMQRRRIIDRFSGTLNVPISFRQWTEELKINLTEVIGLLEKKDDQSIAEARHKVNEMVIRRLVYLHGDSLPILYPVRVEIENKVPYSTSLKVVSQDTPAFLYALSNALSLHGIQIEHVRIRTIRGRIEDEIELVDRRGHAIKDPLLLERIQLSVLLTKQFTYFLAKAPDPYTALSRFELLVGEVLTVPTQRKWIDLLTDPHTLQSLARLLGASDFLWEDFIRLQYETLLPLLEPHIHGRRLSQPSTTLGDRIQEALEGADSLEDQRRRLNEFKDRETFLIDLDHILTPKRDFEFLARELTGLAEAVLNTAVKLIYEDMVRHFGRPRTVAGIEARYALMGLGKLGGADLGYASDLEVLFVYSDHGSTDGIVSLANREFFERLVKELAGFIQAKREGIFRLDLRLRPHGEAGPLACSMESFCRYYGPGGAAHSYERLALVRMRAIGGDPALGAQMERLRDEFIYFSSGIKLDEIYSLREKQFRHKAGPEKLNVKFSPGGLVDLEYGVQILQVLYGKDVKRLRTPQIREALQALTEEEILPTREALRLKEAYDFLRNLINGMRMLRGSAEDLILPEVSAPEFEHLARRMGYEPGGGLRPAQQLFIDFETYTGAVRAFWDKHFGRESLPGPGVGNVVDILLSERMGWDVRERLLSGLGFQAPERAYVNLRHLAGRGGRQEAFARLAVVACDILKQTPDPDMALNNLERFIRSLPSPEFQYNLLLSQPMRLEILLGLFASSQFLADTLIRNPGFLDWVMIPEKLHPLRNEAGLLEELREARHACSHQEEWLNTIRRLRRREILRIGVRDICLKVPIQDVMLELSVLADAMTQVVLEGAWSRVAQGMHGPTQLETLEGQFCVLALGKLGGNELNYSSDIDLVGICSGSLGADFHSGDRGADGGPFATVMEQVRNDLSVHTEEGHAYRVDLRLRPFGGSGELVSTFSSAVAYYRERASIWEIQAALKMRPIAGNLQLGFQLLEEIRPELLSAGSRESIISNINQMRHEGMKRLRRSLTHGFDVKHGLGGIRDIEFLVQGLQLMHAKNHPRILEGNTLRAIDFLQEEEILPEKTCKRLAEDYLFLRRVEHYLQILEDRQIHALPQAPGDLTALAKRMFGTGAEAERFLAEVKACADRIHRSFQLYLR